MADLQNITAVVFDMDGVILDTEHMCMDAWKIVAQERKLEDIEQTVTKCIGTNLAETDRILREAFGETLDCDSLHVRVRELVYKTREESGIPVKLGAAEIFPALKAAGYKIAVASSSRWQSVHDELCDAGFFELFDAVVTGDMIERSKPEPDIYLAACEKLGVDPENAAAIEDSFNGIRSAKAAGMLTIMVPDMLEPDNEILKLVDYKFDNLLQARDLLVKNK